MNPIQKLKQDRVDAFNAAKALHAGAPGGVMSAEQVAQYDGYMATVKNLDASIRIAQEQLDAERNAPAITTASASVGQNNAEKKPWANMGEFMQAVATSAISKGRNVDERLYAALGQNETIDSEGGFLVQPEYSATLLERAFAEGQVTSRCETTPMSSSRLVINGIDDSSRLNGLRYGGIAVYRIAEAALYQRSMIKFRRVEFNANKLIGMFFATDEIMEDAPAMQNQVFKYFPKAFAWQLDYEVIDGSGAGQFLGINTSGATVVVPKTAGQSAGTFTTANALAMRQALWVQSRANAVWFTGPDLEAQLFELTIPGPQGTNVALYTAPGVNGNSSKYGMMLGLPVIPIEQTAVLGTQGDIILADCSQYTIGERSGIQAASSIHVAFETGEQAFRWTMRNDGQPLWDKPLTQLNSANRVSPFVTLATRA